MQSPAALQTRNVGVLPVQAAAPQDSPAALRRQVPVPLQPSSQALLPQVESVPPAGMFVQVPTEPGDVAGLAGPASRRVAQHLPWAQ